MTFVLSTNGQKPKSAEGRFTSTSVAAFSALMTVIR